MKIDEAFRSFSACLTLGYLLVIGITAFAQDIPGYPAMREYDPREVAMLPRYCIHTWEFSTHVPGGNNVAEIERWTALIGPNFSAMHHYCWGLMNTNRAMLLARTNQIKRFYLASSIDEFDFVLRRVPADFMLLAEILTKKGENLIRLGRVPAGAAELQRAIQSKPDYWPPYAALSDQFKNSGDLARAREWLEKGLAAVPDARPLKRRLGELDNPKSKLKR